MHTLTRDAIEQAARHLYQVMPATAQYAWPLLAERLGCTVWVKHENHTPIGAFKVRGGVTFVHWLKREHPEAKGIVTATRGNHGQSLALAATALGLKALIVVPQGNSVEKNNAMRGFGGEVVEYGRDFDEAREEAVRLAQAHGLYLVPPFHPELVKGVATYGLELFNAVPDLDTVYVPIGCGSGICGVIAARDALGLKTQVVGVVSTEATAAKLSFESGTLCETASANTFADGLAVRRPIPEAFAIYGAAAARIVSVSDAEIAEAMRVYYTDTHNLAEGAGAAALAALMQERETMRGKRVAVILSGGNIDRSVYAKLID
ncbi:MULTISPECIES: threonine dehydratase [unclassified Pseudomonas]|jgi:threonine dehydratase|uniref:threonine dehydratase n=1 Tax=unclassified Pseudomonas TaxID=196821 RepID=UPI000D6D5395|nr:MULTISPECIES: threonine dehydratase [unclassified Pseudomonas]PWJ38812.1 threonine dehydratase [Pseudomonas sp. 43mfcvi1.1]QIB08249.1 threonine dehydratase [Pseudomonas fluorescens]WLH60564.1 threonine dehydratase [Pseudomonas sp. FP2300]SSB96076.1 threonine dehydratase [Pseudomonas sp. 43mfcvi1.1]